MTKTTQVACPECHSFKLVDKSIRGQFRNYGGLMIILGFVFTATVIGAILGIPMILFGLIALGISPFLKKEGTFKCKGCGYTFTEVWQNGNATPC